MAVRPSRLAHFTRDREALYAGGVSAPSTRRSEKYTVARRPRETPQGVLEPDSKAYLRASRLMANWMVARVTKERTVAARIS